MATLVNLNTHSQSEGGRIDIVQSLCTAASSVSRMVDTKCWQLYNNYTDIREFEYLTKIGGNDLPAKFQHIPAQRPKLNYLIGRQLERPFQFSVSAVDNSSLIKKKEARTKFYVEKYIASFRGQYNQIEGQLKEILEKKQELEQQLQQKPENEEQHQAQLQAKKAFPQIEAQIETIRQTLQDTEVFTMQNIRKLDQLQRYTNKDFIEITAQKAMKSYMQSLNVKQKGVQNFTASMVTGKEYYYVDYRPGDKLPIYRPLQGHNVFYQAADDVEWVQNLDWAGFEENMTPQDVISEFGLTGGEKTQIENFNTGESSIGSNAGPFVVDENGSVVDGGPNFVPSGSVNASAGINVKRVWWVAERQIKAIRRENPHRKGRYFTNFIGPNDKKQDVVDKKDYKYNYYRDANGKKISQWVLRAQPNDKRGLLETIDDEKAQVIDTNAGDEVVVRYVYDRYKGAIINNSIYKAEKDPIQPRSVDNYSKTLLPIVGQTFNNITQQPYSLIWATKEIQRMINIVSWHKELMFALAGTKTLLYDMLFKPKGMSDKEYRYSRKLGDMPLETKKSGVNQIQSSFNQWQVLDLSLSDSIQYLDKILQNLDIQMGLIMGLSPQAMGQVNNEDQVGTMKMSQQSVMLITEVLYAKHDEVERRALTMMMNIARQYLWDKNTIMSYINENNEEDIVDIPANTLNMADYEILLANNNLEERKLNEFKNYSLQSYSKGTLSLRDFTNIYNSDSLREVQRMAEYIDEEAKRLAGESQQKQNQAMADLQNQKIELQGKMVQVVEEQKRQIDQMNIEVQKQKLQLESYTAKAELELKGRELDLKKELGEFKANSEFESNKMTMQVKNEHNRADESIKIMKARLDHIQKLLESQKQPDKN